MSPEVSASLRARRERSVNAVRMAATELSAAVQAAKRAQAALAQATAGARLLQVPWEVLTQATGLTESQLQHRPATSAATATGSIAPVAMLESRRPGHGPGVNVSRAAQILGVVRTTVYARIESGDLTATTNALGHTRVLGLDDRQPVDPTTVVSVQQALHEITSGFGLPWAYLAQMVGVSVPALRRWRLGGGATPENRTRVVGVLDLLVALRELAGVQSPVGWLLAPMLDGFTTTPRDLYCAQSAVHLLDFATGGVSAEDVLDLLEPGWRTASTLQAPSAA